jgi:SAM-dependent methyltransferase
MATPPRYRRPVTGRPLYHSFAWAYDVVTAAPGGPDAAVVGTVLEENGVEPGARVLDAGCGTGRYAQELARAGFAVTGVDRSAELLAVARERAPEVEFERGDLRVWTGGAPFDAVLCRGVLNDCITDEDRRAVVGGLGRALRPGGVLLVDVRDWAGSVEHYRVKPVHEASAATSEGEFTFRSETAVDPERRLLRVHERIALEGDAEESEFTMRPWTRGELEAALRDAGFHRIEDAPDLGARADRIVVTAIRSP